MYFIVVNFSSLQMLKWSCLEKIFIRLCTSSYISLLWLWMEIYQWLYLQYCRALMILKPHNTHFLSVHHLLSSNEILSHFNFKSQWTFFFNTPKTNKKTKQNYHFAGKGKKNVYLEGWSSQIHDKIKILLLSQYCEIKYCLIPCQGPCTGNQQSLAHSRLWDAVVGFLHVFAHMQMKLSQVSVCVCVRVCGGVKILQ